MTCIVGYLDKKTKRVTIGADSAGVAGLDLSIRKDKKIFRNGEFIIGCTSSFRMIQLLQFRFSPPEIKCKDIYEYMCTDFVDAIRKCFRDGGFLSKDKDVESGGVFLIGYKDRLFCIQSDFQIAENLNGMDACGCGDAYALGCLYSIGNDVSNSDYKVTKALETAANFSAGVHKPFYLMTT